MGFFGIGCMGDDQEGGEPDQQTPTAEASYVVYSRLKVDVKVESGDLSAVLKTSQCIAVKASQIAALKISVGDQVLCDGSSEDNKCEAKNVNVTFADGKYGIVDTMVSGCTAVLGEEKEEEAEEKAAAEEGDSGAAAPAADTGGAATGGDAPTTTPGTS